MLQNMSYDILLNVVKYLNVEFDQFPLLSKYFNKFIQHTKYIITSRILKSYGFQIEYKKSMKVFCDLYKSPTKNIFKYIKSKDDLSYIYLIRIAFSMKSTERYNLINMIVTCKHIHVSLTELINLIYIIDNVDTLNIILNSNKITNVLLPNIVWMRLVMIIPEQKTTIHVDLLKHPRIKKLWDFEMSNMDINEKNKKNMEYSNALNNNYTSIMNIAPIFCDIWLKHLNF